MFNRNTYKMEKFYNSKNIYISNFISENEDGIVISPNKSLFMRVIVDGELLYKELFTGLTYQDSRVKYKTKNRVALEKPVLLKKLIPGLYDEVPSRSFGFILKQFNAPEKKSIKERIRAMF